MIRSCPLDHAVSGAGDGERACRVVKPLLLFESVAPSRMLPR